MLLLLGGMTAPGTADAFIGENLVIDPVTKKLTPAAEKVVKLPGFVPELLTKAKSFGGSSAASGASRVLTAAKVIPGVGSAVLAYGVGEKIGTEICGWLGISGCVTVESEAADPPTGPAIYDGGTWRYHDTQYVSHPTFNVIPPFTWYWDSTDSNVNPNSYTQETPAKCNWTAPGNPPGMTHSASAGSGLTSCGGETINVGGYFYPLRHSMENRTMSFTGADNPSVPNYGGSTPAVSESMDGLATQIAGASTGSDAGSVGQKIASAIEGSGVKDPYIQYVTIPNCDGLVYASCEELLEERGLLPQRQKIGWTEVITTTPAEVLELDPAKATEVEKGSTVVVTTNPDEPGMPIVIPTPEEGETYDDYIARLNPQLSPERRNLEAAYVNPDHGPNTVEQVQPQPDTKLDPSKQHTVKITTNPSDAPVPAGGDWDPPDVPGIDFTPLGSIGTPCTAFPFGLFCWMGEAFEQFNVGGQCPQVSIPVWGENEFDVNGLCSPYAEQVMAILRPIMLFAFIIGMGFLFARGTRAIGGGD